MLQTIAKGMSAALLPASLSLVLAMGSPMPAEAIGPQNLPLEVTEYAEIPCPEGIRCAYSIYSADPVSAAAACLLLPPCHEGPVTMAPASSSILELLCRPV